ncbi:MAG: phosphatase PAP2 family protein [Clostridiales bacterium]|nr:phosphatase PAP2 family protein [Clostridiales bacterium]
MEILNIIQSIRTPALDELMVNITRLGNGGMFWIFLAVLLMCFKKTRRSGVSAAAAMIIGSVVFTLILKNIVCRARPYTMPGAILDAASLLIPPPADYSFPSGHSMASFACASAIFLNNRKIGIAASVLGAAIAFSRMYLYVHYPSDVLCGIIFGIASGVFSNFLLDKVLKKHEGKLSAYFG